MCNNKLSNNIKTDAKILFAIRPGTVFVSSTVGVFGAKITRKRFSTATQSPNHENIAMRRFNAITSTLFHVCRFGEKSEPVKCCDGSVIAYDMLNGQRRLVGSG